MFSQPCKTKQKPLFIYYYLLSVQRPVRRHSISAWFPARLHVPQFHTKLKSSVYPSIPDPSLISFFCFHSPPSNTTPLLNLFLMLQGEFPFHWTPSSFMCTFVLQNSICITVMHVHDSLPWNCKLLERLFGPRFVVFWILYIIAPQSVVCWTSHWSGLGQDKELAPEYKSLVSLNTLVQLTFFIQDFVKEGSVLIYMLAQAP